MVQICATNCLCPGDLITAQIKRRTRENKTKQKYPVLLSEGFRQKSKGQMVVAVQVLALEMFLIPVPNQVLKNVNGLKYLGR